MTWRIISFEEGSETSPEDIRQHFISASDDPTAIVLRAVRPARAGRENVENMVKTTLAHGGLIVLLFDGEADGWLPAMLAAADILLAAENSAFHFSEVPSEIAGLTAALIRRSVGRSAAMNLLLRGTVRAEEMYEAGLVGRIVEPEEIADPESLLTKTFSGVDMHSLTHLKKVWFEQEARESTAALAAERLEFQACFNEGAVESITDYLRTRMVSK